MDATKRLLTAMIERNEVEIDDIASVLFSLTPDLRAVFPALGAREMGWTQRADVAFLRNRRARVARARHPRADARQYHANDSMQSNTSISTERSCCAPISLATTDDLADAVRWHYRHRIDRRFDRACRARTRLGGAGIRPRPGCRKRRIRKGAIDRIAERDEIYGGADVVVRSRRMSAARSKRLDHLRWRVLRRRSAHH